MNELAYLAGVASGDGWVSDLSVGLRVKDFDFAATFSDALASVFKRTQPPRRDGAYWLVRTSNKKGQFSRIRTFVPQNREHHRFWLRGLFDSEGNAQLTKVPRWKRSFHRRVSFFSSEPGTIQRAIEALNLLGIPSSVRIRKPTLGHKGMKTIWELRLRNGKANFGAFLRLVGSSIARKREALREIVATYKPDVSAHCRRIQKLGAKAKHRRTMQVTLPLVVDGVRQLIASGTKPTQRACRAIPGYNTIQGWVPQRKLIAMCG